MQQFLAENSPLLVAVLALIVSLQANIRSRRSSEKSDRLLISGKKLELLQELDRQHTLLLRLKFIVESQLIQFEMCPALLTLLPEENERLKNNLEGLEGMEQICLNQRGRSEAIDVNYDPAKVDAEMSEVRRLITHLEKDIQNESELLATKKHLVATAPKGNDAS